MSGNLYRKDHGAGTAPGYAHKFNEPGIRNVGSYQVAGHPFITGSTFSADNKVHMVEFPYVSKSFTVINTTTGAGSIRVHFQSGSGVTAVSQPGLTGEQTIAATADVITGFHFITVPPDQGSVTFDVKCSKFYVSGDIGGGSDTPSYQVMAELTNIPTNRMYHLTGSGITKAGALGTEHEP